MWRTIRTKSKGEEEGTCGITQRVPVVQRYKYLGIQLDERMSFKEQLNKYNLEVARRQGVVKGASFLSYSEKYKLWKVLIRSLFLYQSIIYKRLGKTSGEKLRVRYLCSIK
jgi:hypothetical protein